MELNSNDNFMCCASWLLKKLPNNIPLKDLWNSDEAKEIRKSVSDGSYRHCDKTQCPYLSQLINFGTSGNIGPLYYKNELPAYIREFYNEETGEMKVGPKMIQFAFDRTCNYKCPSCRIDVITASGSEIKKIEAEIEEIETTFANDITTLYITGSGDPFVSVGFRNFLRNFKPKKYPKLKQIHLHTNASKWNKEMWESMKSIHKYVQTCEISIDAGSKETYENLTRIGGDWNNLMNNLNFIKTLPNLTYIKTSFVVQSHNYKEMELFLNLMKDIFGKKVNVFFGKINNWGSFTDGQFQLLKIWDQSHPEHEQFIKEFNKVFKDSQVYHNMQEFVNVKKTLL
jgi:MoaA/NifB/PqqE/SkfB family radical SAM enzyme